jgi:uncharacterized membrane protein YcaP (DUF421 family)
MRNNGILAVEDIQMAVLETNGTLSIIPKQQAAPPTAKDLKVATPKSGGIPSILVMDGHLIQRNMREKGVDLEKMEAILSGYNIERREVFMLTIDDNGKTFLIKREQK